MNIIRERLQNVGCGKRILEYILAKRKYCRDVNYKRKLSAFIPQLIPQTVIRSCGSNVTLHETKIISRMSLTIQ